MSATDRRAGPRIPLEMWVEERTDRELYYEHGGELSVSGLFLDRSVPHPIGTVVTLAFTLPGDDRRIQVRGEIVSLSGSGEFGMGVRFLDLADADRERIARFIARGLPGGAA
jgi:uncharacterized protein (TIGR02266 family)